MRTLNLFDLGLTPYQEALDIQEILLSKRHNKEIEDSLILLEHPPTITVGRTGNTDNLLINEDRLSKYGITLEKITRGGDITFHGPGQIVGYPIFDLDNHEKDLHKFLRNLEEILIKTVKQFDIEGRRIEKLTGVWVKRSKIASIGIAVRKWVTYHGFALNVNTNLDYFDLIIPCGIQNVRITSIKDWLNKEKEIDQTVVKKLIIKQFKDIFHFDKVISRNSSYIN